MRIARFEYEGRARYGLADPESGKVFCLSTGPSKEAVMRIHQRAGHPTGQVYSLPVEV